MPIVSAAPDGASNHNMTMGRGHRSLLRSSLAHVCYLARLWRLSVGDYANTDLVGIGMASFDVGRGMHPSTEIPSFRHHASLNHGRDGKHRMISAIQWRFRRSAITPVSAIAVRHKHRMLSIVQWRFRHSAITPVSAIAVRRKNWMLSAVRRGG